MKLNDLFKKLERTLNIEETYKKVDLFVKEPLLKKNTGDLKTNLKQIDLSKKFEIKVLKNTTKNFDALSKNTFFSKYKSENSFKTSKEKWFKKIEFKRSGNTSLALFFKRIKYFFIYNRGLPFYILIFFTIVWSILFFDKQYVEYRVNSWYKKLIDIKNDPYNIDYIRKKVNDSKFDFTISNVLFTPFLIIDNKQVNNAYHIIKGWKELTNSLDDLLLMYHKVTLFIEWRKIETIELTSLLLNLKEHFTQIEDGLFKTLYHYKRVLWLKNTDIQSKISEQTAKLEDYLNYITFLNKNFNNILNILGHYENKRYIIVFQNSDEIRPTWWFMWSMWIINVFRWKIKDFEKRDVYAYEWDLKKAEYDRQPAPEWLNQITTTFWLRDANYFVNIENSSKSIKYFIEQIWYKIDGVIYINQNLLLDFLKTSWEIDFKKLWIKINADNFSSIMSSLVEAKTYKIWTLWTPKKILFDFMWEFVEKLKSDASYYTYIKIILNSIKKRDVIFFAFNEEDNKFLKNIWLNSGIDYSKTLDFSYPVYTSISGNKSDRYMRRSYKKTITHLKNCNIKTNLQISSRHWFWKNEENTINELFKTYNISDKKLFDIQWAWDNNQFVRLILPKNSLIEEKENVVIREYKEIKVAEFYLKTKRKQTINFDINYTIINESCEPYSYAFYKQAWIRKYNLSLKLWKESIDNFDIESDFYYPYYK